MKTRTKAFALRVIKLTESLPATRAADVIGKQLLRSATFVGANHRASRRARSRADFVNNRWCVIPISHPLSRESRLPLTCIHVKGSASVVAATTQERIPAGGRARRDSRTSGLVPQAKLADLMRECDEITAIIVASIRTAKTSRG